MLSLFQVRINLKWHAIHSNEFIKQSLLVIVAICGVELKIRLWCLAVIFRLLFAVFEHTADCLLVYFEVCRDVIWPPRAHHLLCCMCVSKGNNSYSSVLVCYVPLLHTLRNNDRSFSGGDPVCIKQFSPSIHQFYVAILGRSGSGQDKVVHTSCSLATSSSSFWGILRHSQTRRDVIPQACPIVFSQWDVSEHLHRDAAWRFLNQMPKQPQVTPFKRKEQRFYREPTYISVTLILSVTR